MLVVKTVGASSYQSRTMGQKVGVLVWQLQEALAIRRRHVATCPPTRERRGHNPVDGAAVCFGRPADDVIDDTAGAIVEAEGGHAHGWQWLQGRGSRGLRCCRLYRIHSCAVGCDGGRLGPTRVLRKYTSSGPFIDG